MASNPCGDPGGRGKGLCIIRKRRSFKVTRARSLFGDMKSAVFGVAWPSAGLEIGVQAISGPVDWVATSLVPTLVPKPGSPNVT